MRVATFLAVIAALWVTPAHATWILGISVHATGTNTPYTPGLPPVVIPVEKDLNFAVTLFSFTNMSDLALSLGHFDPTGLTDSGGFMQGPITLANGILTGGPFHYAGIYRAPFPGSPQYDLSAPSFAVSFIRADGEPAPVPEPATWAMMLVGFGLTGWSLRHASTRRSRNLNWNVLAL